MARRARLTCPESLSLFSRTFFSNPLAVAGVGLVIISMSFKIAIVPFHMWTPDVYTGAPTPVTGFSLLLPKQQVLQYSSESC